MSQLIVWLLILRDWASGQGYRDMTDIVPDLEQLEDYREDKHTNKCSQYSVTSATVEGHRKCTGRKRKEGLNA